MPADQIEHLGFLLNSGNMTVSLTSSKKANLISKARLVIQDPAPSIRAVAELIGIFVSSFTVVDLGSRLRLTGMNSFRLSKFLQITVD